MINKFQKKLNKWLDKNPVENKWAMIYGSLPPETKKSQAIAFNNQENGFTYLVATDAIGMGLNLKIRRIIFSNIYKTYKGKKIQLTPSQILQIAGRAGRYKEDGYVTAFTAESLNYIRKMLRKDSDSHENTKSEYKEIIKPASKNDTDEFKGVEVNIDAIQDQEPEEDHADEFVTIQDVDKQELKDNEYEFEEEREIETIIDHKFNKSQRKIKKAWIYPLYDQLDKFAASVFIKEGRMMTFTETLKQFKKRAKLGDLYFMRDIEDFAKISRKLDEVANLDSEENMINSVKAKSIRKDMYNFCMSPLKLKNNYQSKQLRVIREFFYQLVNFRQVKLPEESNVDFDMLYTKKWTENDINDLEVIHNILEVYVWLANKYEQEFIERDRAIQLIKQVCKIIDEILVSGKQFKFLRADP